MEDAPLVFDMAVDRVKPERVVAVGFSIGSGVAANLSRQRKLDGLILVTPFDSLKAVASDLYPWLPIGPFFQHELAAAEDLKGGKVPVAILAAERDEIIRPARTAALRREVPEPGLRSDHFRGGAQRHLSSQRFPGGDARGPQGSGCRQETTIMFASCSYGTNRIRTWPSQGATSRPIDEGTRPWQRSSKSSA